MTTPLPEWLAIIHLTLFSGALRFPFILNDATDEWLSWWNVRQQENHPLRYTASDSLIDGYTGYPRLPYYLLSRLPERHRPWLGHVLNISFDVAVVVSVYVTGKLLLPGTHQYNSIGGLSPAFWAALLVATTPVLFPLTARITAVKARTFGALFVFLYLIGLALGWKVGLPYFYGLSIAAAVIVATSSSFGLQVLVFFSVILSVFYFSWVPLILLVTSLVTCTVIPNLGFRQILSFKLHHYKWYINSHNGTTIEHRNSLTLLQRFLRNPLSRASSFASWLIRDCTPFIALYSVPGLLILVGFYFWGTDPTSPTLIPQWLHSFSWGVTISSTVMFVATSFRPLLFLGQAERYFEYSVPFISILVIDYLTSTDEAGAWFLVLLLLHLTIIVSIFLYQQRSRLRHHLSSAIPSQHLRDAATYIRMELESPRILTIPVKLSYALSYYVKSPSARFYYLWLVPPTGEGLLHLERDLAMYDYPRTDFEWFKKRYGVDTIVVDRDRLGSATEKGIDYVFDELQVIYRVGSIEIWRL